MTGSNSDVAFTIVLPEASIALLLEKLIPLVPKYSKCEEEFLGGPNLPVSKPTFLEPSSENGDRPKKYTCEVLGVVLSGTTLPEVFASVVDLVDDLDPAVLEKLSRMRPSYARNYISREKEQVHIQSPQLETFHTKSGWWISKNIGRSQLIGAFQALCSVSGLEFGKDLRFQSS